MCLGGQKVKKQRALGQGSAAPDSFPSWMNISTQVSNLASVSSGLPAQGRANSAHGQTVLQGQWGVTLCSELASGPFSCFSKMVREQEELTASGNSQGCWLHENGTHKLESWLSVLLLRKTEGQRMSLFQKLQIKKNRNLLWKVGYKKCLWF